MINLVPYRLGFFLILIIPLELFAQLPEDLADRAYLLHNHLQSNHFRPRDRNNQYGQDIHLRLIEMLDPDRSMFLQRDVEELSIYADSLDEDIILKELHYVERLTSIYRERIEENQKIVEEFSTMVPNLHTLRLDVPDYDTYASNYAERKERWRVHFMKDLENDLLRELQDTVLSKALVDEALNKQWDTKVQQLKERAEEDLDFEDYFDLYFLNAMTLVYDPHSSYFNDEMNEQFTEELSSTHKVFGITYQQNLNGEIEITEILPGSSAWYAEEVEEGAILTEIRSATGQMLNLEEVNTRDLSNFFDQLESDTIFLEMRVHEEVQSAQLVRSKVYSDNDIIKTALLHGTQKIGYISLPDFYTNWTDTSALGCANDVAKAILKLKKSSIAGLILDLRNNGGGSLHEAVDLVGIFIDFGPVLLIEEADGTISPMKDFNRGSIYDGPLMVLINAESASASEVVAGTLQDYNRALIAGQRSFGKATGQSILPLNPFRMYFSDEQENSEGFVKTTDIGLYRLNNETAQINGVLPDVEFPNLSGYTPGYEADEAHAMGLDKIERKVYYTPLAELPKAELSTWYATRENQWLDSLEAMVAQQQNIAEAIRSHVDLVANHARFMEFEDLETKIEALRGRNPASFTASSLQFDEELLRISPYLEEYNRRFLERLRQDIELNEAVQIMQKWTLNK